MGNGGSRRRQHVCNFGPPDLCNLRPPLTPLDVWRRARRRAMGEDRAMRVVLIRALELYAAGRLSL